MENELYERLTLCADSILGVLDLYSEYYGVKRAGILENLIDTLQALEQYREQQ